MDVIFVVFAGNVVIHENQILEMFQNNHNAHGTQGLITNDPQK